MPSGATRIPESPLSLPVEIRPLASQADYAACIALQRATWGDDFRELVSPALLQVAQKMGGVAAGAFQRGRMVGFVFGISGLRDGKPAHWSHMLAVDAAARDAGIGRRLKRYQRDQLVAAGIGRMYWTFDPLVARNAHLNLQRLGAEVVEYVPDMYGTDTMSRTDAEIGTDRFVVAWDLERPDAEPPRAPADQAPTIRSAAEPLPDAPVVRVAVPRDIQQLKADDAAAARAWRTATRRAFQHFLGTGYRVAAFDRGTGPADPVYVLVRPA